ncbi:MAG: hypothetical protein KKB50_02095 [Planctomycetes bacterium]|nr:hypothetical protein [Planctomycetota bacterium]
MRSLLVLIGFCLALPLTASADTAIDTALKHVPDDVGVVVIIPSLDKLASGLADFGKAIGLDELAEINVAEFAEEHFEDMADVLDLKGGFLMAMSPTMEQPLVMLPITSEKAWQEALEAKKLENGMYSFELDLEDAYGAVKGNLLIVAGDEQTLQTALDSSGKFAQRFKQNAGKLVEQNQVVVYVKLEPWQPMIMQGFAMVEPMMQMVMMQGGPEMGKQMNVIMGVTRWFADGLRTLLSEADFYAVGFRAGTAGAHLADLSSFEADGKVGTYLKKISKSTGHLFRGLPDADYAAVFGYEWTVAPGTETLSEGMLKAMVKELSATSAPAAEETPGEKKTDQKALVELLEKSIAVLRKMSGQNCGVTSAPEGKGILVTGLYMTKEAPAVAKQFVELSESGTAMMGQFGMPMDVKLEHETIGSVKTDALHFKFASDDEDLSELLGHIYGESLVTFYAPQEEGVTYVLGPEKVARPQMERTLTGKPGPLAENTRVKAALATLAPDPQVCGLLDAPKVMEWVMGLARALGEEVPEAEIPQTPTPYAAFAMYFDENTVRGELNVPAEMVKVIVDVIKSTEGDDVPEGEAKDKF